MPESASSSFQQPRKPLTVKLPITAAAPVAHTKSLAASAPVVVPPLPLLPLHPQPAFEPVEAPLITETHAVSKRALLWGSIFVAFIAVFTPYNDYILKNTFFIGNHFPIGIVTVIAGMVLVVNPIMNLLKARPFSAGELVVMLAMMLVSAGVPSSGLMRYWEPMLVSPFHALRDYPWLKPIAALIPTWLVPTTDGNSKLVAEYMRGIPGGGRIPLVAFILPAILWGILIAAILGAAVFLAAIFRKQWMQHERLSYPLATLPLELLADPEPGRYYNKLWRNPILWSGALIPVFLYLLSSLHQFFPSVPFVSMSYHFHEAFTEYPWDHVPTYITDNKLYWSIVGLTFFIPSEVALSLWFFLLADGFSNVLFAQANVDPTPMMPVRSVGMYLAYFCAIIWLARRHLFAVARAAIKNTPKDETEFASYRTILVGYLLCMAVAWFWMLAVGVQPLVAFAVLFLGTVLITLMSRIVAETGLMFVGSMWAPPVFLGAVLGPKLVSVASYYWSSIVSRIFFADLRETLMPFATNALRMSSDIKPAARKNLLRWLFLMIALSVLVSGLSQHVTSYIGGRLNMDLYSAGITPVGAMTDTFSFAHTAPASTAKAWWNLTLGGMVVTAVSLGRMTFAWWPFHPIGLLLVHVWPLHVFWFSILIGWIVKQALMHYGGPFVYRRARPFFIGLIVGEILTAGVWMFLGLITGGGISYQLLPG